LFTSFSWNEAESKNMGGDGHLKDLLPRLSKLNR
jgi:hypothetical protein